MLIAMETHKLKHSKSNAVIHRVCTEFCSRHQRQNCNKISAGLFFKKALSICLASCLAVHHFFQDTVFAVYKFLKKSVLVVYRDLGARKMLFGGLCGVVLHHLTLKLLCTAGLFKDCSCKLYCSVQRLRGIEVVLQGLGGVLVILLVLGGVLVGLLVLGGVLDGLLVLVGVLYCWCWEEH